MRIAASATRVPGTGRNLPCARARGVVLAALLLAACGEPAAERVEQYREPVVTMVGPVRDIHNYGPVERFILHAGIPAHPDFLFAGVLHAARDSAGAQAVLSPSGTRLLVFDARGKFERALGEQALSKGIAVTRGAGGWTVVDRDGGVVLIDPAGHAREMFGAPFGLGTLAWFDGGYIAARSPFAVTLLPTRPGSPLLVELARTGQIMATIDTVRTPLSPALGALWNAGEVAADDSLAFFSFLVSDEVRAYDVEGRPRWIADRTMAWPIRPPTVEMTPDGPQLAFRALNLAIAARGPFVYVLSYADALEANMRLDAFDRETGVLRRSAAFAARPLLISLDEHGAVWLAPADTLVALAAPPKLPVLADFRLPTVRGDTFDLASTRGKVVLLNFWASWCPPCRQEFPLMNRLVHELGPRGLEVVAVNEDVDERAARRFLTQVPPDFPVPLGRGKMQDVIGYRGLPFTMLLDREGHVVQRFFGFAGAGQYEALRGAIERALGQK